MGPQAALPALEAPTPHPARGEALVRSWRERHSPARRVAAIVGLVLAGGLVAIARLDAAIPLLAAAWTVALVPWMELMAVRTGAVDWPDRRSARGRPASRLGGAAWYGGILAAGWILHEHGPSAPVLLGAAAVLLPFLVVHELVPISVRLRLAAVTCLATFVVVTGAKTGPWSGAATVAGIVAVSWSFQALGSMEGLVPALAAVSGSAIALAGFRSGDPSAAWLGTSIAAASLAFLVVQARSSRPIGSLLGETGGLMAGFLLAALSAGMDWTATAAETATPALLFAVPAVAAVLGKLRRPHAPWGAPGRLEALLRSRRRAVTVLAVLAGWPAIAAANPGTDGVTGLATAVASLAGALAVLILLNGAGAAAERRRVEESD